MRATARLLQPTERVGASYSTRLTQLRRFSGRAGRRDVPLVVSVPIRGWPAVATAVYLIGTPSHESRCTSTPCLSRDYGQLDRGGLFATAKAILVQLEETRPLIAQAEDAGRYESLPLRYLNLAVNVSFIVAALSAVYLLVNFTNKSTCTRWRRGLDCCGRLGALSYFGVIRVLSVVLDRA